MARRTAERRTRESTRQGPSQKGPDCVRCYRYTRKQAQKLPSVRVAWSGITNKRSEKPKTSVRPSKQASDVGFRGKQAPGQYWQACFAGLLSFHAHVNFSAIFLCISQLIEDCTVQVTGSRTIRGFSSNTSIHRHASGPLCSHASLLHTVL